MDDEMIPDGLDDEDKSDKSVSSDLIRGHINTIILRALYDGDKYGYEIIAEIERKSNGQYTLKQPSLYSALKRLEKDGYITSYWGGSVGGGRRKYFSLTDEGKAVSEQNQAEWEYSRTIIDSLISDRDFDFNNPAPTPVDMRVLKRSTSRIPSREDGDEDFDFEPTFDDTAIRDKLEAEFAERRTQLEQEFEEKRTALEAEYAEKLAAFDESRADFEAEKARIEEEQARREASLTEERNRMFEELRMLREQQEEELTMERQRQEEELAMERQRQEEELAMERERQENALQAAREESSAEDESLRAELELQRKKYEEMCSEHEQQLASEQEAARQRLFEQREASEASLRVERDLHTRALRELTEVHKQEMQQASEAAAQSREDALRALREENERLLSESVQRERERYDALLSEERTRYDRAIAEERDRHDAQTRDDRQRYEEALAAHDEAFRREMERELREREKEIKHNNYISLVSAPTDDAAEPPRPEPASESTERAPEDYRSVVSRLYDNAVRPTAPRPADAAEPTPVSGIDFRDIRARASRDGLRVTTAGGEMPAPPVSDRENTVHKGKALFLSAIVTFFWCILVGGIAMGFRDKLSVPIYYPCIMWAVGAAFLLVTVLLYANHYGENWLRKKTRVVLNAVVIYALLVIGTLIVALSLWKFDTASEVMLFIGFPAIYFIGTLIFGVCYHLQIRPKKDP